MSEIGGEEVTGTGVTFDPRAFWDGFVFAAMSKSLGINFAEHFANELAALAPFEADGLVKRTASGLEVTETGRLFIRNIAMCFDNTLAPVGERRDSRK